MDQEESEPYPELRSLESIFNLTNKTKFIFSWPNKSPTIKQPTDLSFQLLRHQNASNDNQTNNRDLINT